VFLNSWSGSRKEGRVPDGKVRKRGGQPRERSHDAPASRSHERSERSVLKVGGGRGIRTPETLSGSTVFKTAAINRSAIPPRAAFSV
jgi:hypothetical protein